MNASKLPLKDLFRHLRVSPGYFSPKTTSRVICANCSWAFSPCTTQHDPARPLHDLCTTNARPVHNPARPCTTLHDPARPSTTQRDPRSTQHDPALPSTTQHDAQREAPAKKKGGFAPVCPQKMFFSEISGRFAHLRAILVRSDF